MRKIAFLFYSLLIISCTQSPRFELISSDHSGIKFNNFMEESDSLLIIINGAGVGVAYLNNDGLQDLIFAGNKVSSQIYLNLGDFRFKDITSNFTGLDDKQWFSSVTVVDINNDGWQDIYLTSTIGQNAEQRKNRLWVNSGNTDGEELKFFEMADKYGIALSDPSIDAAFFDYDGDRDLDLYVLNSNLIQRSTSSYRPKITDGSAQNNDGLYQNNGDGTFSDVTKEAGILYEGYGLGLAIGDVNRDGFPDIYASNDYLTNDLLYINKGDGTFKNEIKSYLSYQTRSSMGNDMADINNDGCLDIITLDMLPESYHKKRQTINGFKYLYYIMDDKFDYGHQYVRNMLHVHNGFVGDTMLPYSEVGQLCNLHDTEWSWSPLFADFDNDGDKDLIVSNGYPKDMTDKDWLLLRAKQQQNNQGMEEILDLLPPVHVANMAFENMGELDFVKQKEWLPDIPSYSYGASFVDLDNDGDLDYVTNNFNSEAFIFKNNTQENSKGDIHYLQIRLKGNDHNTMAIGAKIEIWYGNKYQFFENFLSRGYASSVDPKAHFGLGNYDHIDSIKVTWPWDDKVSIIKNVGADQVLEIEESKSQKLDENAIPKPKKEYLFTENKNAIDYVHQQTDFADFLLGQKIIPHKFSQIGPALAKGDLNGDGRNDLLVGASNQLPTGVFMRSGNHFISGELEGLTYSKEFTEADLAILDIDNDGDQDVVAIAGGMETVKESHSKNYRFMSMGSRYDTKVEKEFKHYLYINQDGVFTRKQLPVPPFLASVVRPCDYDKDGFTDLFVGARLKRGSYPNAPNSWLIINRGGELLSDTLHSYDLGMVTDAVWTDYDNDGWQDLLITREFNSIQLLRNLQGEKLVEVESVTLGKKHGLWYAVSKGDLDLDGDDDYVLGNLGENNQFTASDKYPLNLYVFDMDRNGTIDPIRTAYWKDSNGKMKEFPINYLDELREQSPYFQMKFKDYTSFSYAGIGEILDRNMLDRVDKKLFVNTTSSYILWNEGEEFRWQRLPVSLQVSPITKILVEDINGDKYPDLILGGNDYSYDVGTGLYDANKGFVLINKGNHSEEGDFGFHLLGPDKSGLVLHGMLKSLLYFEGDTSQIVAGFNRAALTVHERYARQ